MRQHGPAAAARHGPLHPGCLLSPASPGRGRHTQRPTQRLPRRKPAFPAGEVTASGGLVTLVVPAKDEGDAIAGTLLSLPRSTLHAAGYRTEVIVLDGHSTDETVRIARSLGAAVLPDRGHGKGSALREARATFQGDYVIMLDGDGTYAPDAIPRVLALLASGEADVVMGDRFLLDGSMTAVHRAGNALLSLGASMLYGLRVRDLCTGLWGFRSAALRSLPLQGDGFELEAELFALSARLHLRIAHTSVDYLPRTGDSKLGGADGFRIGWSLLRNRFSVLHRRVLPPSPSRDGDLLPHIAAQVSPQVSAQASPERSA